MELSLSLPCGPAQAHYVVASGVQLAGGKAQSYCAFSFQASACITAAPGHWPTPGWQRWEGDSAPRCEGPVRREGNRMRKTYMTFEIKNKLILKEKKIAESFAKRFGNLVESSRSQRFLGNLDVHRSGEPLQPGWTVTYF